MSLETLVVMLVIAVVMATLVRVFIGWTLAGWLVSFMLAMFGAILGWLAQRRLGLPQVYTLSQPAGYNNVPIVWLILGAVVLALLGALFVRPPGRTGDGRVGRMRRRSR